MDPETEAAHRVGTTLCHKWKLDGLIGTGGMAAVYVATHKIGRREAIKILHSELAKDADLRARFEQEAHAVNRFKHPGVVEVRDIDVAEDGAPFLVMELLEGETLASLARRDALPMADLLRWVDELLDVLAAAHARGIIHRDIKPDNLFVQTDGSLKVLDFGIARVRGAMSKPRTRAGATLGTATYMPPEQIHGGEIDARADIFAVGATMFRLIAKRKLHEAANEGEMLVKMGSLPAPHLGDVAPDTPHDVAIIVDRALAFERADRYPDALTMQSDVRSVRDNRTPPFATARLVDGGDPHLPAQGWVVDGPLAKNRPPSSAAASPATRPASPIIAKEASGGSSAESSMPITVDAHRVGAAAIDASAPLRSAGVAGQGLGARTLRSVIGPEGRGGHVEAHGVAVPVEIIHPAPKASGKAPSTQLSGVARPSPAPGESVRVVDAPPSPPRRRTLPGTEISVWPLVLVGVVFAAIGVGVTLGIMLHEAPEPDPAHPQHLSGPHAPAHATPTVHRK